MFNSNNGTFTMPVVPQGMVAGGFGDGLGNGGGGWWVILLILILFGGFGWNNRGFGGYGGAGGQVGDNYVLASDMSQLSRQIADSTAMTERKLDGVNNGLCDGFYSQAQLVNGLDKSIASGNYAIQTGLTNAQIVAMQNQNALQTQIAQCCCDNKALIAQSNYDAATRANTTDTLIGNNFANLNYNIATQDCNTRRTVTDTGRDIIASQEGGTRAILEAIQNMRNDALQDKLATLQSENQTLKFAASQQAQNALLIQNQAAQTQEIINRVSPCPIPAFQVPAPYPYATPTCGCNC